MRMKFKSLITSLLLIVMVFSFNFTAFAAAPPQGGHMAGMATFLDSDSDHVYFPGDTVSFKIGPFNCQAGKTDKVVFGIFDEDINTFDSSSPIFTGLLKGEFYDNYNNSLGNLYYAPLVADGNGYFTFTGTIPAATSLNDGLIGVTVYSDAGTPISSKALNMDAKFPVVDASNNAAVFINLAKKIDPANIDKTLNPFVLTDDDIDHVYFDNDKIKILARLPIPSISGMPGVPSSFKTRFVTGSYDEKGIFTPKKIFKESQIGTFEGIGSAYYIEADMASTGAEIAATIENPGDPFEPGVIALRTFIQMMPGAPFSSSMIGSVAIPLMDSESVPAIIGMGIPDKDVTATPSLNKIKNLYNVENTITFTKDGVGSIIFKPGLSILGAKSQWKSSGTGFNPNGITLANADISKLSTAVKVSAANGEYSFGIDTEAISFLKNHEAGLVLFNAKEKLNIPDLTGVNLNEKLALSATDNQNKQISEIASIIDINNMTYNEVEDTLTVPVKHFTLFKITKKALDTVSDELLNNYTSNYKKLADLSIPAANKFTVKFNKAINEGSLNNIKLINYTDKVYVEAAVIFDDSIKKNVIVTPNGKLEAGKQYMIVIESNCKDESNALIKTGYYAVVK